ncbi:MAG: methionine ABC transporter ATP-binding protein [Bdellovibrio sp.]|nr:methionine ABC transporter ATP-binding protein [Bdellovibrio sp.]
MFELKSVSKTFQLPNKDSLQVLQNLSLTVNKGEIFGLIGLSGAGKSTALRTFNLLEKPDSGHVYFQNKEIHGGQIDQLRLVRQKIGMIFQHFNLISNKTVEENVALPLKIAGWKPALIQARVLECLKLVHLENKNHSYPNQLSGGQKQRVAIARAIANHPDLLLADEPTSALDPITKIEILDCLTEINKKFGLTIIIATHEMNIVRRLCDRVAILDQGQIQEILPVARGEIHPQTKLGKMLLEIT